MSIPYSESVVGDAALDWLEALGYAVLHGPGIAAGVPCAERSIRTTATSCWSVGCARRSCV